MVFTILVPTVFRRRILCSYLLASVFHDGHGSGLARQLYSCCSRVGRSISPKNECRRFPYRRDDHCSLSVWFDTLCMEMRQFNGCIGIILRFLRGVRGWDFADFCLVCIVTRAVAVQAGSKWTASGWNVSAGNNISVLYYYVSELPRYYSAWLRESHRVLKRYPTQFSLKMTFGIQ